MSLATKYRPQKFNEMVEQTISVSILEKQIAMKQFKNAYGFFGASGCGKTTLARCFAKAINGETYEPIEVDAGSMGGVENIKLLLDSASQRDLVGEYKVIVIDECQNLGGGTNKSAWAALLKTLEDCPKYTIFILCSTDPEKVPEAVLNRLQRYSFTPISQQGIKNRLEYICQKEGFTNYEKTCELISKSVHGGMRDAITYLEQVADNSTALDETVAASVLGNISYKVMFDLLWAIQGKDQGTVVTTFDIMFNRGQNIKSFIDKFLEFVLDLAKFKLFRDINLTSIPAYLASQENPVVQYATDNTELNYFISLTECLLNIKTTIKNDTAYKTTAVVLLLQFMRG